MKWLYKYESNMDTNDADYVYQSGQLGVFDDSNIEQMKTVHMTMMYLNAYAEKFDDGRADDDEVRKAFVKKNANLMDLKKQTMMIFTLMHMIINHEIQMMIVVLMIWDFHSHVFLQML